MSGDPTDGDLTDGELSDAQLERYARHVILDEVGEAGQLRLLASRVLVVGAGGLGSPVLLYLAAAGVGTLGIVDDDAVELSNLQRQVVHAAAAAGTPKTASAAASLARLDPALRVECHALRLTEENAGALVRRYDLVVDGSDTLATRFAVNAACVAARVPLVTGALFRFEGQVTVLRPWRGGPCYRCLVPETPAEGTVPRCVEAGLLGPVAGVVGTLQATEALKVLLGLGTPLDGRILFYDALGGRTYEVSVARRPDCPCCGGASAEPA